MSACSLLDEVCHSVIDEVTLERVPALDLSAPALEFECHERTQAPEEMIADGLPAAREEPRGMADLLDGPDGSTRRPRAPGGHDGRPDNERAHLYKQVLGAELLSIQETIGGIVGKLAAADLRESHAPGV